MANTEDPTTSSIMDDPFSNGEKKEPEPITTPSPESVPPSKGCQPTNRQPCQATHQVIKKGDSKLAAILPSIELVKDTRFKLKREEDKQALEQAILAEFPGAKVVFDTVYKKNTPDLKVFRDSTESDIISTVNFVHKDRTNEDVYIQLGYLNFTNDAEQQKLHTIVKSFIEGLASTSIPNDTLVGGAKKRTKKAMKKTHKKKKHMMSRMKHRKGTMKRYRRSI